MAAPFGIVTPMACAGLSLAAVGCTGAAGELAPQDRLAPEVYSIRDAAVWDGRPSFGGVWVAHPEVTAPSRARIARQDGAAAVVGALFRREPVQDEPPFLVSSEAATALELEAGQEVTLDVVALKRAAAPDPDPDPEAVRHPRLRPRPRPEPPPGAGPDPGVQPARTSDPTPPRPIATSPRRASARIIRPETPS